MFVKFRWQLMLFAALVATSGPIGAQGTEAGRFLSVVGDVRVGREGAQQRPAQRAAEFYEGESIVTGSGALAQLRMSDGALMSVRGETEIKLDRFSYAGENDRNASFFMSVLKGGLRTITGVIGRQNRDRYRITTATITLGVRGTDFEIVHVPQAISREVPAGTYNRVYEGVTSIQNRAGVALLVSRDQTVFAALQGTTPPVLVAPPAAIFGRPTPIPQIAPQTLRQDDGKGEKPRAVVPGTGSRPILTPLDTPRAVETIQTAPTTTLQTSPTLAPLDTTRTLTPATTLTPIDTSTTTLTPIRTEATTTITPILTTPTTTTIQTAPTTTLTPIDTTRTLTPTTTISPPTTTLSPTVTPVLTAPTTTIAPTTTTIRTSPTLTPILTTPVTKP
ncbi:MAG TPA: FecR family protein [Burkholderiales bacterium]|nr:FecR family protein [Burkholderiales bacterium]